MSGLVTGAIYSIMASGLVLTYTTSGIFNFAHGAVAFTTAYLYYQLNTGLGVPIVPVGHHLRVHLRPAARVSLLDRILLRRLAKAPVYARIVGTIGLLVALPALIQWLVVTVGNDVVRPRISSATRPPPRVSRCRASGRRRTTTTSRSATSCSTPTRSRCSSSRSIAAVVLWFVIRRTRVGLEMRAVVDREQLAGLRGVNAARTSAVAWVLTMILAGLGGVLIAPLFTLQRLRLHAGRARVARRGRARRAAIDPDRVRSAASLLGVVQNLVAGYSDDILPEFLAKLNGLQAVGAVRPRAHPAACSSAATASRQAGIVAEDVPDPTTAPGMPSGAGACRGRCGPSS